MTGFYFLTDGTPWSGFSGFVSFVIVFRLSAAYSTYWSAYSMANAFLGDWSGAAASAVAMCRGSKASEEEVEAGRRHGRFGLRKEAHGLILGRFRGVSGG